MAEPAGELNKKVLKYANDAKLKQVLTGECAELADEALKAAHALTVREIMGEDKVQIDTDYVWGEEVAYSDVAPGDIIQVRNYKAIWKVKVGNALIDSEESEGHHTMVVSELVNRGNGILKVLHQNTVFGRIVMDQELYFLTTEYSGDFSYVQDKQVKKVNGAVTIEVSGVIKYYRPLPKPAKKK